MLRARNKSDDGNIISLSYYVVRLAKNVGFDAVVTPWMEI